MAAGDWDGDGDIDILAVKYGAENEPFMMDEGYCVPAGPCSGRGFCSKSGLCSCNKDRSQRDCSGCAVGYYTSNVHAGTSIIHPCTRSEMCVVSLNFEQESACQYACQISMVSQKVFVHTV